MHNSFKKHFSKTIDNPPVTINFDNQCYYLRRLSNKDGSVLPNLLLYCVRMCVCVCLCWDRHFYDDTYLMHFDIIWPSYISMKTTSNKKRSIAYHTFSWVSSGRVISLALISSVSGGKNFWWYIFPVTGSSLLPTHLSIRISSGTWILENLIT